MLKRFVGVLAIVMVLVGAPQVVSAEDDQYPNIAGTWTVKALFEGVFELAYPQSFTQDGRTTVVLPTGAGHPNEGDTRIGCMGEWKIRPGRGPREYDVTMKCMYNQAWDGDYGEIRGVFVLDQPGRTFEARFSYSDYAADGTLLYEGWGVMSAARYELKPLP